MIQMCAYNLQITPSDTIIEDLADLRSSKPTIDDIIQAAFEPRGRDYFSPDIASDSDNSETHFNPVPSAQVSVEHLQKKCTQVVHEVGWFHLYQSLGPIDRIRLLDNAGRFGRSWLFAVPTSPVTTLEDRTIRYALKNALLDPMTEFRSQGAVCACGQNDNSMHHLA